MDTQTFIIIAVGVMLAFGIVATIFFFKWRAEKRRADIHGARVDELEKKMIECIRVKADLRVLVRNGDSVEAAGIRGYWAHIFDGEDVRWYGSRDAKGNGIMEQVKRIQL